MVDSVCKENGLNQVLDNSRIEETKLRVQWDDTLVDIEEMSTKLQELSKYGVE